MRLKYENITWRVPAADYRLMKDFKSTLVIAGISKPVVRDEKIK